MNKFSKIKVHWRTYNHCLLVAYLAIVTIGYGWISDTNFQKFSDKVWIWILKIFVGYGSGVKKSISTHLWSVVAGIALWWNLCRALEVFRSSVSEQRIIYAVGVLCTGRAMG